LRRRSCRRTYELIVKIETLAVVETVVVGGYRLRNVEVRNADGALHQVLLRAAERVVLRNETNQSTIIKSD
jgi:hypothetical protein